MIKRRNCRVVKAGKLLFGGLSPVSIQSMTKTDPHDFNAVSEEMRSLVTAGADAVRLAVPDSESVLVLEKIKKRYPEVPLIADVHFDPELAVKSMCAGADKVRVNPGNIGGAGPMSRLAKAASDAKVALRIGINSGSLEKDLLRKHGGPIADALLESALRWTAFMEEMGFVDFVVSLKSSDVLTTIQAYKLVADKIDAPLHLGVTEAGSVRTGSLRSAVALGALLGDGIGDTIRVSLTGPSQEEVRVARTILESLGLKPPSPRVISCPTCGRTRADLAPIVEEVEREAERVSVPLTVAVMGCEVNGPGEAKQADIGVAMGRNNAVIFRKGKVIRVVPKEAMLKEILKEVDKHAEGEPSNPSQASGGTNNAD